MSKNRSTDKRLLAEKDMPPLHRTQPGQQYSYISDEVLDWISKRPGLLMYIFDKLKDGKYIEYDSDTGTWRGANYDED